MTNINRRQFLRLMALGMGAVAVDQFMVACGLKDNITPTLIPAEHETAFPTNAPMAGPDLVVARGGEPEQLVRRAISAFGGIEKVVARG